MVVVGCLRHSYVPNFPPRRTTAQVKRAKGPQNVNILGSLVAPKFYDDGTVIDLTVTSGSKSGPEQE